MCIIFFAYEKHPQYKLILAANRDEFYRRPTAPAGFWKDAPDVLAGRDLEKMGTWMGINKNGRFGAVTNYRDLSLIKENSLSRGNLVKNYITSDESIEEYINKIKAEKDLYNPFNLLIGDVSELYYYSNIEDKVKRLNPGVYGLSNHLLNTLWPKVKRAKEKLEETIYHGEALDIERLFDILFDKWTPKDKDLPDTGVSLEWERTLSPIFIESSDYGTRASTVLLIDKDNHVTFIEKSLINTTKKKWKESRFEFDIS